MPRRTFDNELRELHNEFIEMGEMIENAISESIEAFTKGDAELARKVSKNDYSVNKLEQEIQSKALNMLLRQQPVARDLRKVSTALKVASDMERIGDQSADIADIVLRFADGQQPVQSVRIDEMAKVATEMVKACVSAFICDDIALAEKVIEEDDKLDGLFNNVKNDIVKSLKSADGSDETVNSCIDLLMIAKHFEKIGDHAVNIAEWTKFCDSGVLNDVRLL
ncbi:MAG TPA: phosphate signaling complex protein PhoU [Candidatus Ornithomonoglobus intestinigallinarum]|uniref:Phosphate-specific transport system accessory protein PhoU n=1 Tax=Candidatus Ornithomonoglobus intestinigallinarum TaxID=2840894 RepID=A0A9D1H258_9FIRM|nr:phosphate signaling complex protein PhoU [Candidatus Ornithomonoglobus intestinigallinarum]